MPDTDTLSKLEEWGNLHQIILKAGRTTHVQPENPNPDDAEWDAEAALNALNESDATVDRFRPISEHDPLAPEMPSWTSKVVGDTQLYN